MTREVSSKTRLEVCRDAVVMHVRKCITDRVQAKGNNDMMYKHVKNN